MYRLTGMKSDGDLVTSRLMITAQIDEVEVPNFQNLFLILFFYFGSFQQWTDWSTIDERVDETLL